MKYLIIIVLAMATTGIFAKDKEYVSDYLKRIISPGLLQGNTPEGDQCLVQVSHHPTPTVTNKLFEVKIMDEKRMTHIIYALNDKLNIGGRGECPVVRNLEGGALLINNRASLPPCFGNTHRVNHGMLLYKRMIRSKSFAILNPDGEILKKCIIHY